MCELVGQEMKMRQVMQVQDIDRYEKTKIKNIMYSDAHNISKSKSTKHIYISICEFKLNKIQK